ncbi:MAG: hypothetical protein H8E44_40315 [Planctomycetes bacterium]|nr:hypothetical protein [Planctomycetota bacterium]
MPKIFHCLLISALLATTATARAQQGFDPAARASVIAPFIDEQTVMIVHVDLSRVEVGPLLRFYADVLPIDQRQSAQFKQQMPQIEKASKAMLGAFAKAGGRDVYLGVSLFDIAGNKDPLFMIFPLAKDADTAALSKLLKNAASFSQATTEEIGDALFFGRPDTLERLERMKPDPRPDLIPAFEAAGDTAAQVVFLPPRHTRRVIEEMMPALPDLFGGGPSTVLTRGILWASLGVDLPPKFTLRAVIQSEDPQAAETLRTELDDLIRVIAQRKAVRDILPDLAKIASLVPPSVEGNRLVLNIDENDATTE